MLVIELVGATQSEEELAAIIMGARICHGDQAASVKAQPGMELILKGVRGSDAALSDNTTNHVCDALGRFCVKNSWSIQTISIVTVT